MLAVAVSLLFFGAFCGYFLSAVLSSRRISELYLQAEWWRVRYEHASRMQAPEQTCAIADGRWN